MTPTLLLGEYIVPSGATESLKQTLARTATLQTKSDTHGPELHLLREERRWSEREEQA
jgi:hypothetical protein